MLLDAGRATASLLAMVLVGPHDVPGENPDDVVNGRRTCTRDGIEIERRYRESPRPPTLDLTGVERSGGRRALAESASRSKDRQAGHCTRETTVAAALAAGAVPAPPLPAAEAPALLPSYMQHDTSIRRRPPPPPVPGEPDDLVVVARKLRLMRLHYGADGRIMRFCHADVSSGDPRLDRIGCAIVRVCVRQGHDDKASATACFYRQVDLIDPPPDR